MIGGRPSRRRLIAGAAAVSGGVLLDALALEPRWLDVSLHEVPIDGLPRYLDGFAIAHITDAHLRGLGHVETTMAEQITALDVQLVALTGDIVDGEEQLPVLRELCSSLGRKGRTLLASLGNWEHWGRVPLEALRTAYAGCGVELLVNAWHESASGVQVFASDDSTAGSVSLDGIGAKRDAPARVFLTHSPDLLDGILPDTARFHLALAGHTHGGQVALGPIAPVRPRGSGRFVAGWYDVPLGRAYVSRGTGTSIAPVRFWCRPELPIFTLRRA